MYEDSQDGNTRRLRYEFKTKHDVQYKILMTIYTLNKSARIDFNTVSETPGHTSVIELINTHDAIKVFNTIRHIIYQHKDEIKKVVMSSIPDRTKFYKKMLDHLHLNNKAEVINGQDYIFVTL